jgi:transcriptional regulator with XRE-family HTH domain
MMLEIGSAAEVMPVLVELRKTQGLRQKDVAQLMGIGQPAVSELESGNTAPKLETVQRYADALGYDLEWNLRTKVVRASGDEDA